MGKTPTYAAGAVLAVDRRPVAVEVQDGICATFCKGDVYHVPDGERTRLDYAAWSALGRPTPQPDPTEYVRLP